MQHMKFNLIRCIFKVRTLKVAAAFMAAAVFCSSCSRSPKRADERGIYYWKTVFDMTDADRNFLKEHSINTLYLHLFDVDVESDYDGTEGPVPIATMRFKSAMPDSVEIIPAVYITQSAISCGDKFATQLYERVKAMSVAGEFEDFRELQLDCDWTETSRDDYFALCSEVAGLLHADGRTLSSTVRLHQLKDDAPPVDRGVLMLYNTGSIYDVDEANSIVSLKNVIPYLRDNVDYGVPLSLAFSVYGWNRIFYDGEFRCLASKWEMTDTTLYEKVGDNRYVARQSIEVNGTYLPEGSTVISESSPYGELCEVKALAEKRITSEIDGCILYHFDLKALDSYTDTQINNLLQ